MSRDGFGPYDLSRHDFAPDDSGRNDFGPDDSGRDDFDPDDSDRDDFGSGPRTPLRRRGPKKNAAKVAKASLVARG